MLVVGFFDSDSDVSEFDHKVTTAYRWPVEVFAEHLAEAGLSKVQRRQHQVAERPDRSRRHVIVPSNDQNLWMCFGKGEPSRRMI